MKIKSPFLSFCFFFCLSHFFKGIKSIITQLFLMTKWSPRQQIKGIVHVHMGTFSYTLCICPMQFFLVYSFKMDVVCVVFQYRCWVKILGYPFKIHVVCVVFHFRCWVKISGYPFKIHIVCVVFHFRCWVEILGYPFKIHIVFVVFHFRCWVLGWDFGVPLLLGFWRATSKYLHVFFLLHIFLFKSLFFFSLGLFICKLLSL